MHGGLLQQKTVASGASGSGALERGRWGTPVVVLTATAAWETTGILEPCVLYDGGIFKMWYRGGGLHGPNNALGYATSPDGINWTKYAGNPILGSGAGYETSTLICPNVTKIGSTYYLYYSTALALKVATSSDGINWTYQGVCMSTPTGVDWWGNTCVWKEGYLNWHMIVDTHSPSAGNHWEAMYAHSTNGINWTIGNNSKRLTTLSIEPNALGTYGSLHIVDGSPRVGGGPFQGWYHAAEISKAIDYYEFSNIYRAYSYDRINWTPVPGPIITRSGVGYETQQVADPHVLEVNGMSYMFFDADDNITDICAIELVTFNGTIAQLIQGV